MNDFVEVIAQKRDAKHSVTGKFQRFLGKNTTAIGIVGEQYFAKTFNICADLSFKSKGDGGKDFKIPLLMNGYIENVPVDVKTSSRGDTLLVEQGTVKAKTIYVLIHYDKNNKKCKIVGWQWGLTILRQKPKRWPLEVINHAVDKNDLRNIDELLVRLVK